MDDPITVRGWAKVTRRGGEEWTVPILIVGPRAVLAPGWGDTADVPIYASYVDDGGEAQEHRERTVAKVQMTGEVRDGT